MARSIHTTRRDYERERRRGGDPEQRRKRLARIREELATKRRIKTQVRAGRRNQGLRPIDAPPVRADGVPVRVVDTAPNVIHAATEADIRSVISRLPPGTLTGISEVMLCLGSGHQDPSDSSGGDERDPYCGRVGSEILPGVWAGNVLGIYWPSAQRIQVFAYVAADELLEPEFTLLYLKFQALSTFVHEIAHHQDHTLRVARGRWRADATAQLERYAEAQQHDWIQQVVMPYLKEAYPEACAAMLSWIHAHVGVEVSLALLADDPRVSSNRVIFPVSSAFRSLLEGLAEGKNDQQVRLDFAQELHFGDRFQLALEIVDSVLEGDPRCTRGQVLRADLLEHLERYSEAEDLLGEVLSENSECVEAWAVLGLVHWNRSNWEGVRLAAEARLALLDGQSWERAGILLERCRALLELGDLARLDSELAELSALPSRLDRLRVYGLRALSFLRQERYDETLEAAHEGLACSEGFSVWAHELRVARYLALRALGRAAEPLRTQSLQWVKQEGYGSWLDVDPKPLSRDAPPGLS